MLSYSEGMRIKPFHSKDESELMIILSVFVCCTLLAFVLYNMKCHDVFLLLRLNE
jgi:hypothetical protein